jgi:dsRNA-specific ribonuclease
MDNPNNKLITKEKVEYILNYFENIGNNGEPLKINNLEYYQTAFVHESYYQSIQNYMTTADKDVNVLEKGLFYIPKESSERLEYLGDHILKAVMGRYLFERFGSEREGFLTRLKIKIEKCSMLHKIGVTLGFKEFLLLSLQVENQTILDLDRGRATPSYYEDSFEAFIGSILLDFEEDGYIYADRFVRSVIDNIIDFAELISKNDNFKDSLQRYFQSLKWQTPKYMSLNEEGPLYRKVFTRMLSFTKDQYLSMDPIVQNNIKIYTSTILEEYKIKNPLVFNKLFDLYQQENYILGIGFGRKVTNAEQDCAKQCLINLQLDLNF